MAELCRVSLVIPTITCWARSRATQQLKNFIVSDLYVAHDLGAQHCLHRTSGCQRETWKRPESLSSSTLSVSDEETEIPGVKHLYIIITVLAPYVCVSLCVYLSLCVVCVNVSGCVTNRRREVKGSVFHRKLRAEKETRNNSIWNGSKFPDCLCCPGHLGQRNGIHIPKGISTCRTSIRWGTR